MGSVAANNLATGTTRGQRPSGLDRSRKLLCHHSRHFSARYCATGGKSQHPKRDDPPAINRVTTSSHLRLRGSRLSLMCPKLHHSSARNRLSKPAIRASGPEFSGYEARCQRFYGTRRVLRRAVGELRANRDGCFNSFTHLLQVAFAGTTTLKARASTLARIRRWAATFPLQARRDA